ncbi:hypothetical protein M378DRAFT_165944, partial [Amanita muscaria Koide BX008]
RKTHDSACCTKRFIGRHHDSSRHFREIGSTGKILGSNINRCTHTNKFPDDPRRCFLSLALHGYRGRVDRPKGRHFRSSACSKNIRYGVHWPNGAAERWPLNH